jgi:carbon monoxide dehydrogenase subunit G
VQLTGERILPVDRARAWDALTDPMMLKAAIPGCEAFEREAEDQYRVVMAAALGPVRARFHGHVSVEDVVVARSYRLRFEGEGAAAGFARGDARVTLHDDTAGTRLAFDANAQVGGRIAQVGSRLADPAARKFVEAFFTSLERLLR